MITDDTRIYPIKKENQIKTIQKQANGDLYVVLNSGQEFSVPKCEDLMQAFLIWTIINPDCTV